MWLWFQYGLIYTPRDTFFVDWTIWHHHELKFGGVSLHTIDLKPFYRVITIPFQTWEYICNIKWSVWHRMLVSIIVESTFPDEGTYGTYRLQTHWRVADPILILGVPLLAALANHFSCFEFSNAGTYLRDSLLSDHRHVHLKLCSKKSMRQAVESFRQIHKNNPYNVVIVKYDLQVVNHFNEDQLATVILTICTQQIIWYIHKIFPNLVIHNVLVQFGHNRENTNRSVICLFFVIILLVNGAEFCIFHIISKSCCSETQIDQIGQMWRQRSMGHAK